MKIEDCPQTKVIKVYRKEMAIRVSPRSVFRPMCQSSARNRKMMNRVSNNNCQTNHHVAATGNGSSGSGNKIRARYAG